MAGPVRRDQLRTDLCVPDAGAADQRAIRAIAQGKEADRSADRVHPGRRDRDGRSQPDRDREQRRRRAGRRPRSSAQRRYIRALPPPLRPREGDSLPARSAAAHHAVARHVARRVGAGHAAQGKAAGGKRRRHHHLRSTDHRRARDVRTARAPLGRRTIRGRERRGRAPRRRAGRRRRAGGMDATSVELREPMKLLLATALIAVAPLARGQELDRLRQQVFDAETKLEKSRIHIPSCDNAELRQALEKNVSRYAASTEVKGFAMKRVEGDAAGAPPIALQRYDLSGHGSFPAVHRLLHRFGTFSELRILDFESLRIQPRDGGTVTFDARMDAPCWVGTPAPPVAFPTGKSVVEMEAAAYRQQLDRLLAQQAAIDQLRSRMHPLKLIDALGALDDQWGERPLLLTELRYTAPDLTLRGVTVSTAAEASVGPTLKTAGLDPASIDWKANGDCREFTAKAKV